MSETTAERPIWLTPQELSDREGVPQRTLAQWRYRGKGPRYARFGKHVRYSLADVEQWEAGQQVETEQGRAAS